MNWEQSYFDATEVEMAIRERMKNRKRYDAAHEEQISHIAEDATNLQRGQTGRASIGDFHIVVFHSDAKTSSPFELVTYVL